MSLSIIKRKLYVESVVVFHENYKIIERSLYMTVVFFQQTTKLDLTMDVLIIHPWI